MYGLFTSDSNFKMAEIAVTLTPSITNEFILNNRLIDVKL